MKTNCWLILATMLAAATAVAQVNTNLPAIPPPATATPAAPAAPEPVASPTDTTTNAPAKKVAKAKKKSRKKSSAKLAEKKEKTEKASELPASVTLTPGPATVEVENVNLRGQAGLKGEVVGHAKKGDTVTVLSEITLDKPKAGEPAQWAKISLPSSTKVWVDARYVDASNNVVSAKKLNLRGGPGENYSVLGVIEKGAAITPVTTKENWMEIEPPASAFAFVAAGYLKQEAGAPGNVPPALAATENVPPPTPPPAPPTPTTVPEAPPIAPPAATPPPPETATTPAPATPPPAPETATTTPATPPPAPLLPPPTPTLAPDETDTNLPPPPPRIVTHEGTVRHSVSPVAPTYYEIFDPSSDKAVDYLYTTSTNLNLGRYDGLHITVTGEEAMDPRWKDTPVLTVQKIYVLSSPAPAAPKRRSSAYPK